MDMEEVYLRQITEHLKRQTELQEANNKPTMKEVYLQQITEHLKRQTELQEANNELLKRLLQKLGN